MGLFADSTMFNFYLYYFKRISVITASKCVCCIHGVSCVFYSISCFVLRTLQREGERKRDTSERYVVF